MESGGVHDHVGVMACPVHGNDAARLDALDPGGDQRDIVAQQGVQDAIFRINNDRAGRPDRVRWGHGRDQRRIVELAVPGRRCIPSRARLLIGLQA